MSHIRKLLHFIYPYWKPATASLVLLTAVVFLDLSIPRLVQRIIDEGIHAQNYTVVYQTAALMLAISISSTLLALGNNYLSILTGESVARDLRAAMFVRIQSFSYGNLDRLNTGQLMVRLSSDAAVFQRLTQVFLRIGTRAPLLMLGSLILMYTTDAYLASVMLPILVVAGILIVFFTSKMGPLFLTAQQKLDRLNSILQENIAGVRVVKAFVRESHEIQRFDPANEDFAARNIQVMRFMASMSPSLTLLVNFGIVLVIWVGGIQAINGEITVGQIVAFINYLQTVLGPLGIMVMLSNIIAAATASAERINEVLETTPEVTDAPEGVPLARATRVTFEQVDFHYDGSNQNPALANLNLTGEAGQTIAILGATGAGKTTLINLLMRFYDVDAGAIVIDGQELRHICRTDLRRALGLVLQDTFLFADTVMQNIRYGRLDATDDEVIAAAQMAAADLFIRQLPDGYQTLLSERASNLSQGQRQMLAIARAILANPAILILDEATSSVDTRTEAHIQTALLKLMQGRTSFMIAHRLSTIRDADQVLVIKDGEIIERGKHADLLAQRGFFYHLHLSQFKGNAI